MTKVFKVMILLMKLARIDMYLLDDSSEMILLSNKLVGCLKPS
jgi:hypothetical protein